MLENDNKKFNKTTGRITLNEDEFFKRLEIVFSSEMCEKEEEGNIANSIFVSNEDFHSKYMKKE